jgi:hypothetical protein
MVCLDFLNKYKKINKISIQGFRNILLSENFNIINLSHSRQIYQDMTRYIKKKLIRNIFNLILLDHYVIIISILLIIRTNKFSYFL